MDLLEEGAPGPEERAIASDEASTLRHILTTLTLEQQHLLPLRYGAQMRAADIASLLGKRPVAIRVMLHRTLKELRERYTNYAQHEGD